MRLVIRSAASVMALVLASVTPALAGSHGDITFRLTILGSAVPSDTFSLGVNSSDGRIISPGILCGPMEPNEGQPRPCESRDYDFSASLPVGTELEYTFARYEHYEGSVEGAEILHTGTVTVTTSPQLVTLVYDYSVSTLPDTAFAHPGSSSTPALVMVVATVLALSLATARRRPRR